MDSGVSAPEADRRAGERVAGNTGNTRQGTTTQSGQSTFCIFLLCLFHPQWSVYILCLFCPFHPQWSAYILHLSLLPLSPSMVSLNSASFSAASFILSGQPTFCIFLFCFFHPQWSVYTLSQWSVYTLSFSSASFALCSVVSLHTVSFSSTSFTLSGQSTFCIFFLCLFHPQWSVYILHLSLFFLFHPQWSVYILHHSPLPLSPSKATQSDQPTFCVMVDRA